MKAVLFYLLLAAATSCASMPGEGAYPETANVRQPSRFYEQGLEPMIIEASAYPLAKDARPVDLHLRECKVLLSDDALAELNLDRQDMETSLRGLAVSSLTEYEQVLSVGDFDQADGGEDRLVVDLQLELVSFDEAEIGEQAGLTSLASKATEFLSSKEQSGVNAKVRVFLKRVGASDITIGSRASVGRNLVSEGWRAVEVEGSAENKERIVIEPANEDDLPVALAFAVRGAVVGLLRDFEVQSKQF